MVTVQLKAKALRWVGDKLVTSFVVLVSRERWYILQTCTGVKATPVIHSKASKIWLLGSAWSEWKVYHCVCSNTDT